MIHINHDTYLIDYKGTNGQNPFYTVLFIPLVFEPSQIHH